MFLVFCRFGGVGGKRLVVGGYDVDKKEMLLEFCLVGDDDCVIEGLLWMSFVYDVCCVLGGEDGLFCEVGFLVDDM